MKNNNNNDINPYINGRREWMEIHGGLVRDKRVWQAVGLLSLVLAIIGFSGFIWLSGQTQLVPYMVEVNGKQEVVAAYRAERLRDPATEQKVVEAQLAGFVRDIRGVTADVAVQKFAINRAYAYLSTAYAAYGAIAEHLSKDENAPFKRAELVTVDVEIKQVLPLSNETYRIEWVEKVQDRKSGSTQRLSMTGTVSYAVGAEVNESNLLHNPLGLIIKEFHWQRQLQQSAE